MSIRRPELPLDVVCLALLTLAVAAFFWPLPLSRAWIPRGGGDLVSFLWPTYRFSARSLRSGVIPLWNPYLYSGAPFAADNQSGVFYPVNVLTFVLIGEPSYTVMEALVVFHIWLAGATMFALARELDLRPPAALLGGLAFSLSDLFVTHIGNLNLNATAAWLPLLLLLTHRALTRRVIGWAGGAGAILAVAALAGHAQMLLFLGLTLVLYLLYRLAVDRRSDWRHKARTLGLGAFIFVVGIAGAALMLLPAYQMAGHTSRGHLTYDEAARYSLPPRALVGLLAPGFYGRGPAGFWAPWDRVEVGYAGVATLALAIVGVSVDCTSWIAELKSRVSRLTPHISGLEPPTQVKHRTLTSSADFPTGFFTLLVPLAFLLALGRYTPLYRLFYRYVPTLDQVRVPARLTVVADLGLAALAAYGLDRLVGSRSQGSARIPGAWIGTGGLVAAAVLLAAGVPQARSVPPPDRMQQATASIGIAAVLLALSGLLIWLTQRRRWARWLLPLLLAVDLIGLGSTVEVESNDPTKGFRQKDVIAFLRRDPALFRIEDHAAAWQPDAALVHGLYDIGGIYNPLELAPYRAYRWAMGERGAPLYNLLGAKYVLADKDKPPGDERLVPVYTENPEIDVYLNTAALPRALFIRRQRVVPDHEAAWRAIHAPEFDPTETVVLERGQVAGSRSQIADSTSKSGTAHISFIRYGLNEVELAVRGPTRGWLVLSDVYYPGWRAAVDGAPAEVLRADYTFRAVSLPSGEHKVRMTFSPRTWHAGLAVSLVTWLGLGTWACQGMRKRLSGGSE